MRNFLNSPLAAIRKARSHVILSAAKNLRPPPGHNGVEIVKELLVDVKSLSISYNEREGRRWHKCIMSVTQIPGAY